MLIFALIIWQTIGLTDRYCHNRSIQPSETRPDLGHQLKVCWILYPLCYAGLIAALLIQNSVWSDYIRSQMIFMIASGVEIAITLLFAIVLTRGFLRRKTGGYQSIVSLLPIYLYWSALFCAILWQNYEPLRDIDWFFPCGYGSVIVILLGLLAVYPGLHRLLNRGATAGDNGLTSRALMQVFAVAIVLICCVVVPLLNQEELACIKRDRLVFPSHGELTYFALDAQMVPELRQKLLRVLSAQ